MARVTTVDDFRCPTQSKPTLNLFASCDKITLFDARPAIDPDTGARILAPDGTPVWLAEADLWHRLREHRTYKTVTVAVPFAYDLEGRIKSHVEANRSWPVATFDNVRFESETEPSPGTPYPAPRFAAEWLHGDAAYEEQGWYGQIMKELGLEGSREES